LIFGVGRKTENTRRIIEAVRRRSLPAIPSGGTNVVDVEDVVEGHLRAMARGVIGERYFLGSENLSWKEIIHIIAHAFSVKPPKRILSARAAHLIAVVSEATAILPGVSPLITRERARYTSSTYRYENCKAKEQLGLSFRPFSETMRRVADILVG
jgi:dihydroflavonol-4-reductase